MAGQNGSGEQLHQPRGQCQDGGCEHPEEPTLKPSAMTCAWQGATKTTVRQC